MGTAFVALFLCLSLCRTFTPSFGASYTIYSCPLSSSTSSLSSSGNSDCSSGKRAVHIPYGIRHTYMQIGSTCYDWGNWNQVRGASCSRQDLACCVATKSYETGGSTGCSSRVDEFNRAWMNTGRTYKVLTWNCQVYVDALENFLKHCYSNAASAIPREPSNKFVRFFG